MLKNNRVKGLKKSLVGVIDTNLFKLSDYVSQFTLEKYCFVAVSVYSSNLRVLYTMGISMTRRFQKSVGLSVRPSVSQSFCNAKKISTAPSLLTVE